MPRICYQDKRFSAQTMKVIDQANEICLAYTQQGFTLTLRQLYYQFVSRALIPNKDTEYKRLGSIINDARLAGLLDWDYIEDRTRNVRSNSHWNDPSSIVQSAARSFAMDKWADQPVRLECWIEKDALIGVIEGVCRQNDVPYFSCRGYTSQSEVWSAAMRLVGYRDGGQEPIILHLGDHDPSGLDMTRDILDRMHLFMSDDGYEESADVRRLALNWDQVQRYQPPPNPAKLTDARANRYVKKYGGQSWELDALEPSVIVALIQDAIDSVKDHDAWNEAVEREEMERKVLTKASERWQDVATLLGE